MFNKMLSIAIALAVVLVFMCANMAKAQVVTDGLVSYWSFDEDTIEGDTVKDVWGDNDGTMMGAPKKVEGKVREALEFNGVDDYVETEPSDTLSLIDAGTFEAWIKGTKAHTEIAAVYEVGVNNGLHIGVESQTWVSANLGGSWQHAYSDEGIGIDGEWHHVVGVVSGLVVTLYVDGEMYEGETGGTSNLNLGLSSVVIAKHPIVAGCEFEGLIDEVRVYNRALSEEEVEQNFAAKGLAVVGPAQKLPLTWGKIKAQH